MIARRRPHSAPERDAAAAVLLLLVAAQLHATAAQQAPQLLPAPLLLVPDYYDDDPTATCTTSNIVSTTVDALLAQSAGDAPATVVVQVSLSMTQLLEATVLSTAGLQVVLFQSSGRSL